MIIKRPSIKIRCTLVFELIHSIKWTIQCIYVGCMGDFQPTVFKVYFVFFFFTLYFSLFKWIAFQKQKVSSFVVYERYIGVELNKFLLQLKNYTFQFILFTKRFSHIWKIPSMADYILVQSITTITCTNRTLQLAFDWFNEYFVANVWHGYLQNRTNFLIGHKVVEEVGPNFSLKIVLTFFILQ